MTERTKSGKTRRPGPRPATRRSRARDGGTLSNFGALPWTALLLTFSVALAAAAVFTRKPL